MCGESTTTQSGNTASYVPDWLSSQAQRLGRTATNAVTSNPYQAYTGPTQAAFGPTFQTAQDMTTARASATDPNYSAGTSALLQGLGLAGATASTPVSGLMSQYTNAALQPTLDAIQRQAATANQGMATGATMAGAFGDTGYGTQRATNDYNTTQAISGATGAAYDRAYSNALSTQQTALSQLFGGVGQATGLGSASNASQTAIGQLLASMGATQQQAGQTGINTAINVNQSNQMGRLQQLQTAGGVLSSLPHNSTGTSWGQTTKPDNTGFGLLGTLVSGLPGLNLGSTSFGGFDYGSSDIASAAQAGVQSGLKFNPMTGDVE